jgi:hypothetical protein
MYSVSTEKKDERQGKGVLKKTNKNNGLWVTFGRTIAEGLSEKLWPEI